MFETKTIVLILVILLLILYAYKMNNKSEDLSLVSTNTFVQDFIKSKLDLSGNFILTDNSNNNIMKFKVIKDVTSLDNITVLNDNNEGTLINDGDNNMILIGKIKISGEDYSFIYSITDIGVDNSGNLNLVGITPALKYTNPNQIKFNDGILTIFVDNTGNSVNFALDNSGNSVNFALNNDNSGNSVNFALNNYKNVGSKLIGYTDNSGNHGFGIKLQNGDKKMIGNLTDISNKLKSYYPHEFNLITSAIFTSLQTNLQTFLNNLINQCKNIKI